MVSRIRNCLLQFLNLGLESFFMPIIWHRHFDIHFDILGPLAYVELTDKILRIGKMLVIKWKIYLFLTKKLKSNE